MHVRSWTHRAHPGLHVIRYEDLLDDPSKAFGGVARFLGLSPPPERLAKAIEFSSFGVLRAQEESVGFRERAEKQERFFREGKAGQWREVLTEAQVRRIVSRHRDQMARFGYVPEGF